MRLEDKVAIVTGVDAGSIGQATAILFAEEGARVVVTDIDPEAGSLVVAHIKKQGGEALFLKMDINSEREIKQACEETVRAFGGVDILVNNDAVFVPRGLTTAAGDWPSSLRLNVIGASALMSRHAAQAMKAQEKGAIVNIVSLSGPRPQSTAYSSTSATVMQMTRDMAVDLAPDNIRVNCVCHGAVRSVTSLENAGPADQTNRPKHLLSRTGQPREVASAILFLASDEASFITGSHLLVDGGHYGTAESSFHQRISSRVASFS